MTEISTPKLGWAILHVPNVSDAVDFYERAFGLQRRFIHPEGEYAEMETGTTTLAFTSLSLVARLELPGETTNAASKPHGAEIALIYEAAQIDEAYRRAVVAGAEAAKQPEKKPWGQVVGFVRDPNGFLVEICTQVTDS